MGMGNRRIPAVEEKKRLSDANSETLRSYEARVAEYVEGTPSEVTGAVKEWIDAVLSGLSAEARIVELGSAFGRDAAYIASKGFAVECTDAVAGFVVELHSRGFKARQFNLLSDDFDRGYDLIFANAVFLHFNRSEFVVVLKKLIGALASGGCCAFSLKRGKGEAWSEAKIGAPRYFCYWERDDLDPLLHDAGFSRWSVEEVHTARAHADWLYVTAWAPLR